MKCKLFLLLLSVMLCVLLISCDASKPNEPSSTTATSATSATSATTAETTVAATTEAHVHVWDAGKVIIEVSCMEDGYTLYTCSCGETQMEVSGKKDHDYSTTVIAPTFDAQGYTLYACKNCPHTYKDDYVDVLTVGLDDWLPITDYGYGGNAAQINFMTYGDYAHDYMLVQDTDDEDMMRSAAYSRTKKIEELFNVDLNVIKTQDCLGFLQASLIASGGEYELLYPAPAEGAAMMENNLLTNLCTYEHLHLDQPWWNSSADTFRIDNRLYFAASDYSLMGQGIVGMIYNRDLLHQVGLDQTYDIDQLVWNKQWTMPILREIAMKYGKDTDGKITTLGGTYGMIFQNYHTNAYYWSMGGTIVSKDQNEYYLSMDADYAHAMGNALYDLVHNSEDKVYVMPSVPWKFFEGSGEWKYYKQGNAIFMSFELGVHAKSLQSVPFDVGFAPLPMLGDGMQKDYYSIQGSGFFMIPKKALDPVRSSVLLEALSIESYVNVRSNLAKYTLLGREGNPEYEKDSAMLELIYGSVTYDLGYTWSFGGSSSILKMVVDEGDTSVKMMVMGRWKDMSKTLDLIAAIRSGTYD